MKRIVRLTESDLIKLVKRVINEQSGEDSDILNVGNVSLKIGDRILIAGKNSRFRYLGKISDLVVNNDMVDMKINGFLTSHENILHANKLELERQETKSGPRGKDALDWEITKRCVYVQFRKPSKIFTQQVADEKNVPTIEVENFDRAYVIDSSSDC
jgi:hypothetical protein